MPSSPLTIDKHALAFLEKAESSRIQLGETSRFRAIAPKVLSCSIAQSQLLGGTLLHHFWVTLSQCHPKLRDNIEQLKSAVEPLSSEQSLILLFEGIDREELDFEPLFMMASELLTHLGTFMDPGELKFESDTPFSVNDAVGMATEKLAALAAKEGFGEEQEEALNVLAMRRDGDLCALTAAPFSYDVRRDYLPILAHIIPKSIHSKPDTMKYIAMFAGVDTAKLVWEKLNSLDNVMILEMNAHAAYNALIWGIEAWDDGGTVKYTYRKLSDSNSPGPGPIHLLDGQEIKFGKGPEASQLGAGPDPLICNLQLAVARVLEMSGAAKLIVQLMEDGEEDDGIWWNSATPEGRERSGVKQRGSPTLGSPSLLFV